MGGTVRYSTSVTADGWLVGGRGSGGVRSSPGCRVAPLPGRDGTGELPTAFSEEAGGQLQSEEQPQLWFPLCRICHAYLLRESVP